jgi:hypothetical protein
VHIFPDAEAFERHLIGVDENVRKAYEFIEIEKLEIYEIQRNSADQMNSTPARGLP